MLDLLPAALVAVAVLGILGSATAGNNVMEESTPPHGRVKVLARVVYAGGYVIHQGHRYYSRRLVPCAGDAVAIDLSPLCGEDPHLAVWSLLPHGRKARGEYVTASSRGAWLADARMIRGRPPPPVLHDLSEDLRRAVRRLARYEALGQKAERDRLASARDAMLPTVTNTHGWTHLFQALEGAREDVIERSKAVVRFWEQER